MFSNSFTFKPTRETRYSYPSFRSESVSDNNKNESKSKNIS